MNNKKFAFIAASYLFGATIMAQTATIDLTKEYQTIRGYGGINLPEWISQGDMTDEQCNTAFGNDDGQLGLSILRIYINDNSSYWSKAVPTAKRAAAHGAIIFATPWNPPSNMTETVQRNNRSEKILKYDSYQAYTDHLISFNNYMKEQGVNLYAMSFANEPDYGSEWTWYSADEVYNYTKNYLGQLRVNGTKTITAESFQYYKYMYDQILNDADALKNVDILGTHLYGTSVSNFAYALADSKLSSSQERWMTEHYTTSETSTTDTPTANLWPLALDVAYEVHNAMVEGQFSGYVWWYIRRHYGLMTEDGAVSKRGWCLAQWSKFVRPGYVRIDVDKNPTYNVYLSAFKNNDDVVFVAVNRSTVEKTLTVTIPNTKVKTWERYVTSETKNVQKEASVVSESGTFQITLEPSSATTFVGKAEIGTPSVTITQPGDGSLIEMGNEIVLTASASDPDGTIASVSYYDGEMLIGTGSGSDYELRWSDYTEGTHTLTAIATDNDGNQAVSAEVVITAHVPQAPYTGEPNEIPGTLEVENYDLGGEGIAYHDAEEENKGGIYRNDGVDLDGNDEDGYVLGWTIRDEWLEYTVDVKEERVYHYSAYVTSGSDASGFQLYLDDKVITDTVAVPNTGGWGNQYLTELTGTTEILAGGTHILKLRITGSYCNIDKILFHSTESTGIKEPILSLGSKTYSIYTTLGIYVGEVSCRPADLTEQLKTIVPGEGVYVARTQEESQLVIVK